jgi:hypothetical protein
LITLSLVSGLKRPSAGSAWVEASASSAIIVAQAMRTTSRATILEMLLLSGAELCSGAPSPHHPWWHRFCTGQGPAEADELESYWSLRQLPYPSQHHGMSRLADAAQNGYPSTHFGSSSRTVSKQRRQPSIHRQRIACPARALLASMPSTCEASGHD